jgi:hypothetical protein
MPRSREIPVVEWPTFLDGFSREHRAWRATIDRVHPGLPDLTEAVDSPLAAVVPRVTADRITRIEIRLQEGPHAREPIQVDAPIRLHVDETVEGIARGLEILDHEGGCTRIRFRAAPLPETLDGIAPGELSS